MVEFIVYFDSNLCKFTYNQTNRRNLSIYCNLEVVRVHLLDNRVRFLQNIYRELLQHIVNKIR
jgi:hypothetical protein